MNAGGATGRYVKIQLEEGTNALTLAEVEVFGVSMPVGTGDSL